MNIPAISVDVQQGFPTGAVQSVPAGATGTASGAVGTTALQNEFAATFGATLRQSERQGPISLQNGAKDVESGKLVAGRSTLAGSGSGTTVLSSAVASLKDFTAKGTAVLKADGSKTGLQKTNGESEAVAAGETGLKASVLNATAQSATADAVETSVDETSAGSKAVSEVPVVYKAGVDSQGAVLKGLSAKSPVLEAGSKGTAISNKTAASVKANVAVLEASLIEPSKSKLVFDQVATINTPDTGSANAGEPSTESLPTESTSGLAVSLQNNLAAAKDLKGELAADTNTSEKVLPGAVIAAEIPAKATTPKTSALAGTVAKLQGPRTAAKSGQESVSSGSLDAVKAVAAAAVAASPNDAAIQATPAIPVVPLAVAPTAVAADTLAAPLSLSGIKQGGIKTDSTNNGLDQAKLDAPVKAEVSAVKPSATSRATQSNGSEKVASAKSDTAFASAARAAIPDVSNNQDEAAIATQAAFVSPLAAQPATNSVSTPAADKTVKGVQQIALDSKVAATTAPTAKPGQDIFHLDLKNTTQATGPEVSRADSDSKNPAVQGRITGTPDKPVTEKPVAEKEIAAATNSTRLATEKTLAQEPLERARPVEDSAKQIAQNDIPGAVSTPAPVIASSTNVHASDKAASIAPAIAADVVPTSAAVSGLQAAAPAAQAAVQAAVQGTTAIAAPHLVVGAPSALSNTGNNAATVETGRLSATGATLPADPHRTIVATPTTLEVGVPSGTQGWLRIRAEVGDEGGVNASLAAGSNAGQEMLHRQLPALNAYLHSEQIPVTTSVADRVFAAAGGSLAGMAAGSNGTGGSDASGRQMNQDAASQNAMAASAGNQGGGAQGDGRQRDLVPSFEAVSANDPARSYDSRSGTSDTAAAASRTTGEGESGRWLNVRA